MGQVLYFGKEPKPINQRSAHERNKRHIHVMLCKGAVNKIFVGIYRIWFNEKFYIGRSNNIRARAKKHMKDVELAFNNKNPKTGFQESVVKFLNETPDFSVIKLEILEECDEFSLNEKEQYWLSKHGSDPNCFNIRINAGRTARDKAKDEFKPGIYQIQYKITNAHQYIWFKEQAKCPFAVSSKLIKPM